jgi:hypothetical protein
MAMKLLENDPDCYRKMSEPFTNEQELADAFKAFYEGVSELRKKHRMADVYVIVAFNCLDGDDESQRFGSFQFGNQLMAEGLTAWAYGREQAERDAMIGRAVVQGRKKGKAE